MTVCPKKANKSGGVDVHAVKSYSTAGCQSHQQQTSSQQAAAAQQAQQAAAQQTQHAAAAQQTQQAAAAQQAQQAAAAQQAQQQANVLAEQKSQAKAAAARAAKTPSAHAVLGATKTLHKPAHGVLGKVSKVGTLPFTGFPLWTALLAGLALLAGGLVLRRRTTLQH